MLRGFTLLAGVALLSGCAFSAPSDVKSVEEVIANIKVLDGQDVSVRGWLGQCFGNDCGLYQSIEDARIVERGDYDSDEWSAAMDRRLSIGPSDSFDAMASIMQFKEVVIRGQVNAKCMTGRDPDNSDFGFMCLDRASDIEPQSIRLLVS